MKLHQSILTEDSTATDRQARLKQEIEAGQSPTIHNGSLSKDASVYTMGDLEKLGWVDKNYTHDSGGEVDGWTRSYHGPKPIKVGKRTIKSGDVV